MTLGSPGAAPKCGVKRSEVGRGTYHFHMDVSKNRGGPLKWMVKIMENPIKMDDLGVPLFLETPICAMVKSRVLLGMGDLPPLMTESL